MLTLEQQEVVDTVCSSIGENKIIAVNAIAGSGKTSTAKAVIETYKPKNGFYTAFNKAIVTDSAKKFGNLIDCKTIHALAYKYIKPKNIEELTVLSIKEDLEYDTKVRLINKLDDFYTSSYIDIYEYIENNVESYEEELKELIPIYATKMLNKEIPVTFNFLLKYLHVMLLNGDITLEKDLLIFDEMQDTTGVMLEIFKLISADRKLILGDKFQNIYSFMNTVNAFDKLEDLYELRLTKSFRCNSNIANTIEQFGKLYLTDNFKYTGNDNTAKDNGIVYLSRTNSGLIERMYELIQSNQSFSLNKDINTIFALPIALVNASLGNPVFDKKYKFLEKEYNIYKKNSKNYNNFFSYLELSLNDSILNSTTKLITRLRNKGVNIFDLRSKVQKVKPNPNIILSTTHTFKGLEKDTVYIENDLNASFINVRDNFSTIAYKTENISTNNVRQYLTNEQKELLNLYYVALSRAKTKILNSEFIYRSN